LLRGRAFCKVTNKQYLSRKLMLWLPNRTLERGIGLGKNKKILFCFET